MLGRRGLRLRNRPRSDDLKPADPVVALATILSLLLGLLLLAAIFGCSTVGNLAGRTGTPDFARAEPIYPIPTQTLRQKAEILQARISDAHMSPEGLLLYQVELPAHEGTHLRDAADIADGPSWEGFLVGALGLKLAVEGPSQDTIGLLRLAVQGLAWNFVVTGQRGALARSYVRHDSPEPLPWMKRKLQAERPGSYWRRSTAAPEYWYRGGAAKGHYRYANLGLAIVIALQYSGDIDLPPDLFALVVDVQLALTDWLIDGGYNIRDANGIPTEYGLLSDWVVDGISGATVVAMLRTAERAGDERAGRELDALVEAGIGEGIASLLTDRATWFRIAGPDKHSDTMGIYSDALAFWFVRDGTPPDAELLSDFRAGLRAVYTHERFSRKSFSIRSEELV